MKQNIKYILLFLSITVLLTSCSYNNSTYSEEIKEFSYELSTEEMLEDYEALWEILMNDFPYLESLKRQGVRVESLKESYKNMIMDIESFDDYCELLNMLTLYDLKGEGHLYLVGPEVFNTYNSYYKNFEDLEGWDDIKKLTCSAYLDESAEKRYSSMSELKDNKTSYNYDFENFKLIENKKFKTLIIDYNSFWIEDENEINSNLKEIKDALDRNTYDNIVFDLRGNLGGAHLIWKQIVSLLIDEDYEETQYYLSYGIESKKAFENLIDNDEYIREHVKEHKDLGDNKIVYSVREKIESKKTINYNPNIYLVLDNYSQSATLMFAEFAKSSDFAKLLARNNLNGSHGGWSFPTGVKATVLPNSNLVLQNYAFIKCDENGVPVNPIIQPDIIVDNKISYDRLLYTINNKYTLLENNT